MQAQADYQRLLRTTQCASLACLRALPAEVPHARRARACSTLLASPFLRSPHPPVPLLPSGPSPSAPPEHIPSSHRSTSPLCPLQRVFASVAWDQATFGPTIDPSGELPAPVTLLATSAPGLGPPPATSAPRLGPPLLQHRVWARPHVHICTGTGPVAAASIPDRRHVRAGRGLAYARPIVQLEDLLRTRGGCAHVDVIAGSVGEDGSAHPATHGNHH